MVTVVPSPLPLSMSSDPPHMRSRRSRTFHIPMWLPSPSESFAGSKPSPLSHTAISWAASVPCVLTRTSPSSRTNAPWRIAFSTMGCSVSGGTQKPSSRMSYSTRMVSKRVISMSV